MAKDNWVMPFGKYKGEALENLPLDYLIWMAETIEFKNEAFKEEVKHQIDLKRGKGVIRERYE